MSGASRSTPSRPPPVPASSLRSPSRLPGALDLSAVVTAAAAEGDLTGFVRLTRGADVRRVPFWLRVARPGLARRGHRPASLTRAVPRGHARQAVARLALPVSGRAGRRRRLRRAAGPRAGLPVHADEAGCELRGRHRPPRRRSPGRASRRLRGRREPPHRVRSPARQPQPLPGPVRCARARSRRRAAARGHLRRRLRQSHGRRRRQLRVPLLDRRHEAADGHRSSATGCGGASR